MSYSLNRCSLPPWVLGSRHFNEDPERFELQGVSRSDRFLFAELDRLDDPVRRAEFFNDYMSVKFHLHEWEESDTRQARRSIRNSYLRFLRGWGVDSNSVEGAVLKGWVESRIGLAPCYHKIRLPEAPEDYSPFVMDRVAGSAHTNDIDGQLDLVFAYCQYEFFRSDPERRWLRLFRGTYDATEHAVVERFDARSYVVRLNNLASFTSDKERAWEFGTTVWEVQVPVCKVFFHGHLLPQSILKGEDEYLVIGGEYRVRELLF